MTIEQARMIVYNPEAYSEAKVREAAIFILGQFLPDREDFERAAILI